MAAAAPLGNSEPPSWSLKYANASVTTAAGVASTAESVDSADESDAGATRMASDVHTAASQDSIAATFAFSAMGLDANEMIAMRCAVRGSILTDLVVAEAHSDTVH